MGVFRKRGKYWIDYYAVGRRRRECVGEVPRRIAEQALKIRRAEVVQGKYSIPQSRKPRFRDIADRFLEFAKTNNKSSTFRRYRTILVRNLLPEFGRLRAAEITPWQIEKYKARRTRETSPSNTNRELSVLRRTFNLGIQWDLVESNPMRKVRLFREPEPKERILASEEESRLLAACPNESIRNVVVCALETGMRKNEILTLSWGDVDLTRRVVTVRWSNAKNSKSREIPVANRLLEMLQRLPRRGDRVFLKERDRGTPGYVRIDSFFHSIRKRAGLSDLRFHDLRHTYATRLVTEGVDLATVQRILGHSTIEMTIRYSHPTVDATRKVIEVLERFENQQSDGHLSDTTAPTALPDRGLSIVK